MSFKHESDDPWEHLHSLMNKANRKPYQPLSEEQHSNLVKAGHIKKSGKLTDSGRKYYYEEFHRREHAERQDIAREVAEANAAWEKHKTSQHSEEEAPLNGHVTEERARELISQNRELNFIRSRR